HARKADRLIGRLRNLPSPGNSGSDNRVESAHVRNRVFQWQHLPVAKANTPGEIVPLQRVLVARRNLDGLPIGTGGRRAVVEKDPTGTVGRGVEGNLDLEMRLRSKDMDSLGRDELG